MALNQASRQKLDNVLARHAELETELSRPEVAKDTDKLTALSREFSEMQGIVTAYRRFTDTRDDLEKTRKDFDAQNDPEMKELFQDEIENLGNALDEQEAALQAVLFPEEDVRNRNMMLEIRGGAGGLEAALFAGDLHRMYSRFAEIKGWKTEPISSHPSPMGGFKEIVFAVRGEDAFKYLRYESGVHRVQRVPLTESGGRIHTSTATVAVLIEPDDVDIQVNPVDLKIDTFRASSAGGQHVNKTDSAVRITHLPTGVVVECQDERSQHQNKAKAMRLLRARLLQAAEEEQLREIAEDRKNQVGTGDRSERIRTYNFPQGRVSDHRAGITLYKLALIMEGYMDELLESVGEYFKQSSQEQQAGSA
jgi:peptide chain release factor 1